MAAMYAFAYDLLTVENNYLLDTKLLDRLRNIDQFQGARYELYARAFVLRAGMRVELEDDFLTSMYTNRADFVFTVTRDFVRSMRTPLLIAPDDVPSHPYKVAMEVAGLAPNAEVTIYPWKESKETIDQVAAHARRFLKMHEPVRA